MRKGEVDPDYSWLLLLHYHGFSFGKGFSGGTVVKNLPANAGDTRHGLDPWVRKIPCRRKWQPTPVFLPREFHGQRILAGYSPWGHKEEDTTKYTHLNAD